MPLVSLPTDADIFVGRNSESANASEQAQHKLLPAHVGDLAFRSSFKFQGPMGKSATIAFVTIRAFAMLESESMKLSNAQFPKYLLVDPIAEESTTRRSAKLEDRRCATGTLSKGQGSALR